MILRFKDFAPDVEKRGFFSTEYESLKDCVMWANQWIAAEEPAFVTVETVVLPNLWDEEGSEDPAIAISGEMHSTWHQFVRVWYRA